MILKRYSAECCLYLNALKERNAQINIYRIEEHLRKNFKNNLTIKEISRRFYMHPAYIGQLFLKKFGVGFHEYLHRLRIQEAMRLLDEGFLKAHEIAVEVGYKNYHCFLEYFQKYAGCKPTAYKSRTNQ